MERIVIKSSDRELLANSFVLIIEDDRMQRLMIRQIFENMGVKNIFEASDGESGWEATLKIEPDLVILDMSMPIMDGFDYCRRLRNHPSLKHITILVQTWLNDANDKTKIFKVGASDYITKPLDFYEIAFRSLVHLRNTSNFKKIKKYNTRIKHELQAAKNLIDISLPSIAKLQEIKKKYNIDIASEYNCTQEMGGDFWDICPINKNLVSLYLIDVSGHGIDSALHALRIHTLIKVSNMKKPHNVLNWLNKNLIELFPTGKFATIFFGIIDIQKKILSYSAAASTSPVIINNNYKTRIISGEGFPLGVVKDPQYETKEVFLREGDKIILYSDALEETFDKKDVMFGENRLIKLFKQSIKSSQSSEESVKFILNKFYKQCGEKLNDDFTLNFYGL